MGFKKSIDVGPRISTSAAHTQRLGVQYVGAATSRVNDVPRSKRSFSPSRRVNEGGGDRTGWRGRPKKVKRQPGKQAREWKSLSERRGRSSAVLAAVLACFGSVMRFKIG